MVKEKLSMCMRRLEVKPSPAEVLLEPTKEMSLFRKINKKTHLISLPHQLKISLEIVLQLIKGTHGELT